MAHQDDWDRGFHAGKAQGAVDADAKLRDLERQLEKAKQANYRSQIKAQLTQAQAEIAALREVVEAAVPLRGWALMHVQTSESANRMLDAFDAARAKLKETT